MFPSHKKLFLLLICGLISLTQFGQFTVIETVEKNVNCRGTDCEYDGPSILINEIMLSPSGDKDGSLFGRAVGSTTGQEGEWIELYNPDECKPADVSCFYLGNNTYSYDDSFIRDFYGGGLRIPAGTVVPPLGFLVIRGPNAAPLPDSLLVENGGNTLELVADSIITCRENNTRLWFPNAGGWFAFYNADGVPQDAVSWEESDDWLYAYEYKPCVATSENCPNADSLASYLEIPADRKNFITDTITTRSGRSMQRKRDGGDWAFGQETPPTYGYCNADCGRDQELSCTGSISLNISGGQAPYDVVWNDARGQLGAQAIFLCAGTYCATITDANGSSETHCFEIKDVETTLKMEEVGVLCVSDNPVKLKTQPSASNGDTIFFQGSNAIEGDNFVPAVAGTGTHKVVGTYQTKFGCEAKDSLLIEVGTSPVYQLGILESGDTLTNTQYCEGTGPTQLILMGLEDALSTYEVSFETEKNGVVQSYPSIILTQQNNRFLFDDAAGDYELRIAKIKVGDEVFCPNNINSVGILVIEEPKIGIDFPSIPVCFGTPIKVDFTLNDRPDYSFEIRENTGKDDSVYVLNGPSVFSAHLYPDNWGDLEYELNGLYDGGNPVCFSDTVVRFDVEVVNTGSTSINGEDTWCEGEPFEVFVDIESQDDVSVVYEIDGVVDSVVGAAPGVMLSGNLDPGNYQLKLLSVTGESQSKCAGNANGAFNIKIQRLPNLTASFAPNPVCLNENVRLNLEGFGFGPFKVDFEDELGNPFTLTFNDTGSVGFIARKGLEVGFTEIRDNSQANRNGGVGECSSVLSENLNALVNDLPDVSFTISEDTICEGEEVLLGFSFQGASPFSFGLSNLDFNQNFNGIRNGFSTARYPKKPGQQYWLNNLRDANGCNDPDLIDTLRVVVNQNPNPNVNTDLRSSCVPLLSNFIFDEGNVPLASAVYLVGNQKITGISGEENVRFNVDGSFDLTGILESEEGCVTEFEIEDFYIAHPYPVADFSFYPPVVTPENNSVSFNELASSEAVKWEWQFQADSNLILSTRHDNPKLLLPYDPGTEIAIRLVVNSEFNCRDTVFKYIIIEEPVAIYIPNALTVNGDEVNERFSISVSNPDIIENFLFEIYNRWGEKIATFRDPQFVWDARYKAGDVITEQYVWRMQYKVAGIADPRQHRGVINVLK